MLRTTMTALAVMICTAAVAASEDKAVTMAGASVTAAPVNVSASYNINAPLIGTSPDEVATEERHYKKAMYQRASGECEDLLATIAVSCQITNIGVSSQINRYPGQPATVYVSVNISMQVALKQ